MKIVIISILSFILIGCASTKIRVLDYDTHEPIQGALIMVSESHYPFSKSTFIAYKTNKNGEVFVDYKPSDMVAGKIGYWHARESLKNIIFLVNENKSPCLIGKYGGLGIMVLDYLPKSDAYYSDWIKYIEYERKLQYDYIVNKSKKDYKDLPVEKIEPTFIRLQNNKRNDFLQLHKKENCHKNLTPQWGE